MRAIAIGLAAVMLSGAAEAGKENARLGCKLDGLELVAEGLPEFEGKSFRISKIESHFDRIKSPRLNDFKSDGYVIALLEGDAGRFILSETYAGYGMPSDYGRLARATDKEVASINAKRRSAAGEKARVNGVFYIFNDEYEGLSFFPVACK